MASFWQPGSIRFRLTAWYALTLASGLVLFALAIWFSMRQSLLQDVDGALLDRAASTESFLNSELGIPAVHLSEELSEYAQAFPANSFLLIRGPNGARVFNSSAAFPWLPRWNGHAYRLMTKGIAVQGQTWIVSLAAPLDAAEHLLERLKLLLIGLIPVVIALSAVGGNWLSRRALKPVDDVTAEARSIGIENLSQRLVVPQTGDEIQRLSETWNSMLARLEDAVRRLTSFTADASHELRTPLAVIRSTAEIASRKLRPAESYRRSLTEIVAESERMTQMVEDLLFLARGDAGSIDAPMERLDLALTVADVCAHIATLVELKALSLSFAPPSHPIQILANEQTIRRLVLILLDNAVKYSKQGGQIAVSLSQEQQEIRFAVRDSGPGIPDSERPFIFERFYRSPFARQAGQGTGLGLSLAAGIAQHHGATIHVDSVPNEGSTFTVVFPPIESSISSLLPESGMSPAEPRAVGANLRT